MKFSEGIKKSLADTIFLLDRLYDPTADYPKIEDAFHKSFWDQLRIEKKVKSRGFKPDKEYLDAFRALDTYHTALAMGALFPFEFASSQYQPALNYLGFDDIMPLRNDSQLKSRFSECFKEDIIDKKENIANKNQIQFAF
jgi:hypothetical protein